MPLKKGSSQATISKNIESELHEYNKSGKIGTSHPKSKEAARAQAAAIAYSKAGKSRKKKKMKKFLEALKTKENSALIETIEKGLMICLENMASNMSIEDATRIASQWHNGEGSELYLFASTGKIHDKQALSEEIEGNLNALLISGIDDADKEIKENELLDLKDFVDSAPGPGVPSSNVMEAEEPKTLMFVRRKWGDVPVQFIKKLPNLDNSEEQFLVKNVDPMDPPRTSSGESAEYEVPKSQIIFKTETQAKADEQNLKDSMASIPYNSDEDPNRYFNDGHEFKILSKRKNGGESETWSFQGKEIWRAKYIEPYLMGKEMTIGSGEPGIRIVPKKNYKGLTA